MKNEKKQADFQSLIMLSILPNAINNSYVTSVSILHHPLPTDVQCRVSNWRPIISNNPFPTKSRHSFGLQTETLANIARGYLHLQWISSFWSAKILNNNSNRNHCWTKTKGGGLSFWPKELLSNIITYQKLVHSMFWVTVVTENRRTKKPRIWKWLEGFMSH